jgi:DNA polymerase-3 subunit alpha
LIPPWKFSTRWIISNWPATCCCRIFRCPPGSATQDEYLRHLTFEGARKRYGSITHDIEERLNFELEVIRNSGYPGYFLIVQDFTTTARQMGVAVGPGRGSAAGSAVAYCTGITNIDPIKYDLLFERFLNPERVSMPDIDIDFDDEGRDKVINYVIEKYGRNQVAQIVTYGTMAAKLSLRDVGRVMNIPLSKWTKWPKPSRRTSRHRSKKCSLPATWTPN